MIVLILAAGEGKRMKSNEPKVLHKVDFKPMLIHVVDTALRLHPKKIGIIVGKHKEIIEQTINSWQCNILDERDPNLIEYIYQKEPKGTGHAIMCSEYFLEANMNDCNKVLILSGDVPLIRMQTLSRLINYQMYEGCILINIIDAKKTAGYGRIIKIEENKFKIVEEKDANDEQKKINIINCGIYCFNIDKLLKNIKLLENNNAQKEYYLTDVICHFKLKLEFPQHSYEVLGVNTKEELENLNKII